jgi:hypothetical protein
MNGCASMHEEKHHRGRSGPGIVSVVETAKDLLEGSPAFKVKVVANVLAIVKSELDGYESWNAAEAEGLRAC